MKEIFIYRHAKTLPAEGYQRDHERDLEESGKEECAKIGEWMATEGWLPEKVLCSSAVRAVKTWEYTEQAAGKTFPKEITDKLYLASAGELFRTVNGCDDSLESIMLVGHNPGLHEFTLHFARHHAGFMEKLAFSFPTGTLVHLLLDVDSWKDVSPAIKADKFEIITPKKLAPV